MPEENNKGGLMPAWGRNNNNKPTVNSPASPAAFAMAQRSATAEQAKDIDPYDFVLEAVKDELKTGRRLSPAAYDNPTDEDYAVVAEISRRQIQAFNVNAPSRGLPLLVEGPESETAAETERIARRMSDDVLGWGPIAPYMSDPNVEEIFINGHKDIFVQRGGRPIEPSTGSTAFSQVEGGKLKSPTVFASYTNYYIESVLLLRHAVNTLKLSKIAVAYINQGFGLEGAGGVEADIAKMGGKAKLVAKVPHEPSETSLSVQALKLKESDADAVVLYTADAYAISLLREMAKIGYKPQVLASSVLAGSTMFQAGPTTQWNGAIIASFLPFPSALLVDGKGDPKADAALADIAKYSPNPEAVKTDPFRVLAGYAFAQPLTSII